MVVGAKDSGPGMLNCLSHSRLSGSFAPPPELDVTLLIKKYRTTIEVTCLVPIRREVILGSASQANINQRT